MRARTNNRPEGEQSREGAFAMSGRRRLRPQLRGRRAGIAPPRETDRRDRRCGVSRFQCLLARLEPRDRQGREVFEVRDLGLGCRAGHEIENRQCSDGLSAISLERYADGETESQRTGHECVVARARRSGRLRRRAEHPGGRRPERGRRSARCCRHPARSAIRSRCGPDRRH